MLLKSCYKQNSRGRGGGEAAGILFCLFLGLQVATGLARVDNSWRRPNVTAAQNQWHQAGANRPQLPVYNRHNQTYGGQRPQFQPSTVRPGGSPIIGFRNNQTYPIRNQANHPSYSNQGALNQTRPNWGQPQYPAYGQSTFNQTRPGWPQPKTATPRPIHNQPRPGWPQPAAASFNQSQPTRQPVGPASSNQPRPAWPQPAAASFNQSQPTRQPVGPAYPNQPQPAWPQPQQPTFNQSRPAWPQPAVPYVPQNPSHGQTQPSWPQQPSAPYNPALPASNLYPQLPNNPNTKPVAPSHSWTPTANQTHLYPQLPNQNLQPSNSNGIPLAPLQPATNPQGPNNWHSGGQSALSYGPGYYPPADPNRSNNNPSKPQASSNPYANMFI